MMAGYDLPNHISTQKKQGGIKRLIERIAWWRIAIAVVSVGLWYGGWKLWELLF